VVNTEFFEDLLHLPLSQEAYSEFEDLEELCDLTNHSIQEGNIDTWSYIWGSSIFSTKQAYKDLIGHQTVPPQFKWIWNSSCQARHKFFFGFFFMKDSIQGTCWARNNLSFNLITVPH
jgi:hypothetical protein